MNFLSFLKSSVLSLFDKIPVPFNRPASPDPAGPGIFELEASAEIELRDFVRDGCYVQHKPPELSDLGDACIWQGVYAAMCVHRWRVKKSDFSKALLIEASEALAKYVRNGVLHRGAMPTALQGVLFNKDKTKVYLDDSDGYTYRDDASLDSLLGFCYGAATIMKLGCPEAASTIFNACKSLTVRFTADNYKLVNRDGSPTKYGNCTPGFFQAPVRTMAACLPSLIAGAAEWRDIARKYAPEFSTTDTQIPGKMSWINAHLAILASLTYVMVTGEKDNGHAQACRGVEKLLDKYSDAGNAFLIFGAQSSGQKISRDERRAAELVLSEFPFKAKTAWPVMPKNEQPTPVWLRPRMDIVWQRNPYEQGGGDHPDIALNKMDFLLAHYMNQGNS